MSTTSRRNDADLAGLAFLSLAAMVLFWVGLIFVIRLAVKHGYPPIKRFYTHPDPGVRRRRRRATALSMTAACASMTIASLVLASYAVATFTTFCTAAAAFWWYREQRGLRQRANAAIAARADQQHNWVMQGDDRGIYGPPGAQLMRVVQAPTPVAASSALLAARRRMGPSATRFAS
jgi:hypothetical protein